MKYIIYLAILLPAFWGCSENSGDYMGSGNVPTPAPSSTPSPEPTSPPSLYCEEAHSELISLEDVTSLGFSARDVLDNIITEYQGALKYHGPYADSIIELYPTYDNGGLRFVTIDPETQPGDGSSCSDRVEIVLDVRLRTLDGHLDEAFTTTLRATSREFAGFYAELDADNLLGTFEFNDFDPREYDARTLELQTEFASGDFRGQVHGRGDVYEDASNSSSTKLTPTPPPTTAPYAIRSLFADWPDDY